MPWRDEETILGPTQRLTPEGFLLCKDVPIARTGEQLYHASELPMLSMRDGMISVMREPAEVFDAASIASFSGKPIVNDHPDGFVDPDNVAAHQLGTVTNVRRGDGVLLADLLFTTRRGIELVRNGKRGVSVGYDARYEQTGPDTARQRRIRANHVALVDEARCGPVCSIGDSAKGGAMRTRDETCSLGAPILIEEAKAAGVKATRETAGIATPVCDRLRATGGWNDAWTPFHDLDPSWTEQFMAVGIPVYGGGVLPHRLAELLSIAFDASFTHMYAPGTRRHIKAALKAGATMEEIMEVLKLCVIQGIEAANMALPILAKELEHAEMKGSVLSAGRA
jgi:alkylhydroperoxidase/carboxymuconolactone decarboxylase family protein YurZ